jgi:hypothetical protein
VKSNASIYTVFRPQHEVEIISGSSLQPQPGRWHPRQFLKQIQSPHPMFIPASLDELAEVAIADDLNRVRGRQATSLT